MLTGLTTSKWVSDDAQHLRFRVTANPKLTRSAKLKRPTVPFGGLVLHIVIPRHGDFQVALKLLAQLRAVALEQLKAFRAIQNCRTAALGGHLDACPRCGHQAISYNSCLMGSNSLWGV